MLIQRVLGPQNHMYRHVVLNRNSLKNSTRSIKTYWVSQIRKGWLQGTSTTIVWFKLWVCFVLIVPFHLFCVWVFNMYGGLDVGCLPKPLQKWMLWWPFWTLLGVSLGGMHDSRLKHVSRSSAGLVRGANESGRPCRGLTGTYWSRGASVSTNASERSA